MLKEFIVEAVLLCAFPKFSQVTFNLSQFFTPLLFYKVN